MKSAFNACDTIIKSLQEKTEKVFHKDHIWHYAANVLSLFHILFFRAALGSQQNWQKGTEFLIYPSPLLDSLPYYQYPSPLWLFCYHHKPPFQAHGSHQGSDVRLDPYSLATLTSFHGGHSWCYVSSGFGHMCNVRYLSLQGHIERNSTSLKTPFSSYVFPPPQSLATSNVFSVSIVWSFLECQIV